MSAPQKNPAKRIRPVAIAFRIESFLHEKPVRFVSLVTKTASHVNLSIPIDHPASSAIFQFEFL
jgi:hypothetical protein